ncbi:MAG: flagellar biosynthesis protein FlhF [Pelotomaculum sp.]|nr:flagellar biosynthesis protein FlhF [Pelotomaculum sp.]
MKIKRYLVREMQEAIRLIKQDLGPEAVIVSSYKVPAKGLIGFFSPRLLEVTAVLDESPKLDIRVDCPPAQMAVGEARLAESLIGPGENRQKVLYEGRRADRSAGGFYPAGNGRSSELIKINLPEAGKPPALCREGWQGNGSGNLFENMVKKQIAAGLKEDPVLKWRKMLLDMEVQENIVEHLLSVAGSGGNLSGDGSRRFFFNLQKRVIDLLETAYRPGENARILTFVGPAGMGKTTTLTKLAARFSLYDRKKIAVIAVNTYRIGGEAERLLAYGNLLGIPVEVVMTPLELAKVLESHTDKDYILIDTNGRSARSTGQLLELKGFLDVVKEPHDIFLVLSSAAKNRDLSRIAWEFQKVGYTKLIFTKVDETETHGSILNLVCALGAPVAYLADGQEIPDDISEAGPKKIARLLFRGVDPDEVMAT